MTERVVESIDQYEESDLALNTPVHLFTLPGGPVSTRALPMASGRTWCKAAQEAIMIAREAERLVRHSNELTAEIGKRGTIFLGSEADARKAEYDQLAEESDRTFRRLKDLTDEYHGKIAELVASYLEQTGVACDMATATMSQINAAFDTLYQLTDPTALAQLLTLRKRARQVADLAKASEKK